MKVCPLLLLFALWGTVNVCGQSKQHYQAGTVGSETINLTLNAASVSCKISPTYSTQAVNIFGYPQEDHFNPIVYNHQKDINLNFEEGSNQTLSTSLSAKVFSQLNETRENLWYVYLARNTPFNLELNYGVGSSSVDLSGLSVERFKINTGSAEIRVGFENSRPNKIKMDTLLAKVDMGVLELDKLDLARAEQVITQIGFGKIYMQFTDRIESSTIHASVGAGMLEVVFDDINTPVIIYLNDSPLCRVKLPKNFKKIAPETFVNSTYSTSATNTLSFNIDVSMGNVVFRKSR